MRLPGAFTYLPAENAGKTRRTRSVGAFLRENEALALKGAVPCFFQLSCAWPERGVAKFRVRVASVL